MQEDILVQLETHELGNDVQTHELLVDAAKEITVLRNTMSDLGEAIVLYLLDRTKESVLLLDQALSKWENYKDGNNVN